jgi:hypothetical protein
VRGETERSRGLAGSPHGPEHPRVGGSTPSLGTTHATRSAWAIGKDGKIAYRELVADQGTEPDYDAMLAAVKRAGA